MPRTPKKLRQPFVLLVGVVGFVDDARVEKDNRGSDGVGGSHHGVAMVDPDLRCGHAHSFGEGVHTGDAFYSGEQVLGHCGGAVGVGGKVEVTGGLAEDGGAGLEDAQALHRGRWLGLDYNEIPSDSGVFRCERNRYSMR
jgi:hypothetical protein